MSTQHDDHVDPRTAREALPCAHDLRAATATATATTLLTHYYVVWAAVTAVFTLALYGWFALDGRPWALAVLVVPYVVAIVALVVWYHRAARGVRPRKGPWTAIGVVSSVLPWSLCAAFAPQLVRGGFHGWVVGLPYLAAGTAATLLLVLAARLVTQRGV